MTEPACVVRLDVLEAFTALVEREIPQLAGRTCAGQAPSNEDEQIPNLSIEPTRWAYQMDQQDQHAVLPGNTVVYNVGNHEAGCVISIIAASPRQRAKLEQLVIDLFLAGEHPLTGMPLPGTIVFTVGDCPAVSLWSCSLELDSDEWIEGGALDRRYEARLMVTATVPALSVKRPVYSIAELILGVQAGPVGTPIAAQPVDLVTINFDGTLAPVA